jgi:hypothetical protein
VQGAATLGTQGAVVVGGYNCLAQGQNNLSVTGPILLPLGYLKPYINLEWILKEN